ncbi:MAG: hypothetical protein ACRCUY_02290 [Thermoguttaceae bacterium]
MNTDGVHGQQHPPTYVGGSPNNTRRLTLAARQNNTRQLTLAAHQNKTRRLTLAVRQT